MDEPQPKGNKTERIVFIIAALMVISVLLYYCTNAFA
jgi:hypothetical protein